MSHNENLVKIPIIRNDYASNKAKVNPNFSLIDCGLGHSPLGYPVEVEDVLTRILSKELNEYPSDPYARDLSKKVRNRFHLKKKTPVYFNGAGSYGMLASILSDFVSHEAIQQGLKVVGYGPQFTNIVLLSDRAGIPYTSIQPSLHASIDEKIDSLTQQRIEDDSSAIVYVDNPNNPTGDTVHVDTITNLLKVTQDKDLVIVDEAYADLISDKNSAIPLVEQFPHLIVVRSISKGIGLASPRLGYAVMSESLGKVYNNFELVFSVDAVTYLLAQAALNPEVLADFLPGIRQRTSELKEQFVSVLEKHGIYVYPTHSDVSILMAKGPRGFYKKLLELSISSEDGKTFKPTHQKLSNSFVRFRIPGSEEEIEELDQRLKLLRR